MKPVFNCTGWKWKVNDTVLYDAYSVCKSKIKEVYRKHYCDVNISDILSNTHVNEKYKYDFKISRVKDPHRRSTFQWDKIENVVWNWYGNSQVNVKDRWRGISLCTEKGNIYKKEIKNLVTNVSNLCDKVKQMENESIYWRYIIIIIVVVVIVSCIGELIFEIICSIVFI